MFVYNGKRKEDFPSGDSDGINKAADAASCEEYFWNACMLSRVQLSATPWTVTHQAPLSMGFSRQEYWSGFPFPTPASLTWVLNTGKEVKGVKQCWNYIMKTFIRQWAILLDSISFKDYDGILGCYNKRHMCACMLSCFSCVWLFEKLWTIAHQANLSMGFLRQEYWSGLPFPPPGDLPNPGIQPMTLTLPTLACEFFTTGKPMKILLTGFAQ